MNIKAYMVVAASAYNPKNRMLQLQGYPGYIWEEWCNDENENWFDLQLSRYYFVDMELAQLYVTYLEKLRDAHIEKQRQLSQCPLEKKRKRLHLRIHSPHISTRCIIVPVYLDCAVDATFSGLDTMGFFAKYNYTREDIEEKIRKIPLTVAEVYNEFEHECGELCKEVAAKIRRFWFF